MSQHMSHPAMMQHNGYMTQGGVMQGPDGNMIGMPLGGTASAGGLQSENSNEYLAPHALQTHQAASKKSFRIRGQVERDHMKLMGSTSQKDIGMINFNNGKYISPILQLTQFYLLLDILKSVYELRKSHAALASRPSSSNPFNQTRRNIQSAVPRT